MFLRKAESLEKDLRHLSKGDLRTYIVMSGDATETLFRAQVDRENVYGSREPWQLCNSMDECYGKLLNDTNRARFFFTYDLSRRFEIKKRGACNKLTVFHPKSALASVPAGMYYSLGVPEPRREALDREILELRLDNTIQVEIDRGNPLPDCHPEKASIGPSVVGWLLLPIFVVAMVLIAGGALVKYMVRRRQATSASGAEIERVAQEIDSQKEKLAAAEISMASLRTLSETST